MESLLPVIVGGIIGVAGGAISPLLLEIWKRKMERDNLKGALISEINSLLQIVERRKYVEGLKNLISRAEISADEKKLYFYFFSVRRKPFPVYDANLSRIGILEKPLPQKIARFYAQSSSIMEDIADMKEGQTVPQDSKASIVRLHNLLELFKDTIALGQEIVRSLAK